MKRLGFLALPALLMVTTAFAQRADLAGLKICIDPGHGGYGSNDRHIIPDLGIDFWESESNFEKAKHLKAVLEAKGAWVVLTRNSNSGTTYLNSSDPDEPSLTARWQLANANNVDWFHSIHSNATALPLGQNLTTNYTLLLVKEDIATRQASWTEGVTMSDLIGPSIQRKLRTSPRSKYTDLDYTFYGGPNGGFNLGVLQGLAMPGELSEGSFHDLYPETRRLMNNSYRKMEAYAIRDAFLQYFGVPADTSCIVAGLLKNSSGTPINGVRVRLLPENIVYYGDNYNNGFYMLDGIAAGQHTVRFETPGFRVDSVEVNVTAASTNFFDRTLEPVAVPVGPTAGVVPSTFELRQNYPNPFNPKTAISFQLSAESFVALRVFDLLGREVAVLVNERKAPGTYRIVWDAGNLPSGAYLYRLTAGSFSDSKKMVLGK